MAATARLVMSSPSALGHRRQMGDGDRRARGLELRFGLEQVDYRRAGAGFFDGSVGSAHHRQQNGLRHRPAGRAEVTTTSTALPELGRERERERGAEEEERRKRARDENEMRGEE
jgi:hypothetical protein